MQLPPIILSSAMSQPGLGRKKTKARREVMAKGKRKLNVNPTRGVNISFISPQFHAAKEIEIRKMRKMGRRQGQMLPPVGRCLDQVAREGVCFSHTMRACQAPAITPATMEVRMVTTRLGSVMRIFLSPLLEGLFLLF